jgi:hypothetical protein
VVDWCLELTWRDVLVRMDLELLGVFVAWMGWEYRRVGTTAGIVSIAQPILHERHVTVAEFC